MSSDPATTSASLFASASPLARPHRAQSGGQPGRADDGGDDDVHVLMAGEINQSAFTGENSGAARTQQILQAIQLRFISKSNRMRRKFLRLLGELIHLAVAPSARRGRAAEMPNDIQRTASD